MFRCFFYLLIACGLSSAAYPLKRSPDFLVNGLSVEYGFLRVEQNESEKYLEDYSHEIAVTFGIRSGYDWQIHWKLSFQRGYLKEDLGLGEKDLNLYSIAQQMDWLVRIYHPLYLSFGPVFQYSLPTHDFVPEFETLEFFVDRFYLGAQLGLILFHESGFTGGLSTVYKRNTVENNYHQWGGVFNFGYVL